MGEPHAPPGPAAAKRAAPRFEVLQRVEGHLCVERRVDGQVGRLSGAERVAILLGLGDGIHADVPASAGLVVDDEGPLVVLQGYLIRDQTRQHIRASGRRERHNDLDGL